MSWAEKRNWLTAWGIPQSRLPFEPGGDTEYLARVSLPRVHAELVQALDLVPEHALRLRDALCAGHVDGWADGFLRASDNLCILGHLLGDEARAAGCEQAVLLAQRAGWPTGSLMRLFQVQIACFGIAPGDTPATNVASALFVAMVDQWLAEREVSADMKRAS